MASQNQEQQARLFTTVETYVGYRNREDKTKLASNCMVEGSQNVLVDVSGRLKSRKGYTLDGQANSATTPILSCYDWEEHKGSVIHLRNPSGSLQFRHVDSNGVVTYHNLKITAVVAMSTIQPIRYTNYWDDSEKINVLLFVDGQAFIHQWNGAIATFDSATTNTITLQGSKTWAELGFYVSSNKTIVINNVEYTYTGGESTTTLTGVSPDPTGAGITAGTVIHQKVYSIAASVPLPSGFNPDVISNLQNQIYYGSLKSNLVYVSALNNYQSTSFTTPVRIVGEGAKITLRDNVVAFIPQEESMYVAAGKSQWYRTKKTLSSDNAKESFEILPLKSASQQSAKSQEAITKDKNSVIFISNEPVLSSLGRVDNIADTPQLDDYSYPIVNDFDNFDFTDASVKYYKNYIYVCVPREGKLLIFNQTNPQAVFWEAPQTFPISCISIIDGNLYGHSSDILESYRLFDGYSDNGHPIQSRAVFAYTNYGSKGEAKSFEEFFVDGYLSSNTTVTVRYKLDLDGCATILTRQIRGDDTQITCPIADDASLGKSSLGKHGLGTSNNLTEPDSLPPYFNVILTGVKRNFYHVQYSFESYGEDYHWELLSFGPNVTKALYANNSIKQ